jgi:hypothetical protein
VSSTNPAGNASPAAGGTRAGSASPAQSVPGHLLQTAQSIGVAQLPSGAIPWPDGHVDPWDHVECAMALSACGLAREARSGYEWLAAAQRADGSWPRSFGPAIPPSSRAAIPPGSRATQSAIIPTDSAAESHHAAYVAVGVWHEYLVTGDLGFAMRMWPVVWKAIEWVLTLQTLRGEFAWERDASGAPGEFALLSGCASIYQGLRCATALAELAGDPQPDWELAAGQLAHVVACHPEAFADKSRFAMDWYYPVLGGALRGEAAASRLASSWDTFIVPGLGVRCVSDQPWVTVAETCELVMSLDACGLRTQAREVFATVAPLRHGDGSYWTGWQYVNAQHFPDERSSWTSAAVILAADALTGFSGGAGIFRDAPSVDAEASVDADGNSVGMAPANGPATASASGTLAPGTPIPATYGTQPTADPYPPVDPEACGCSTASARARVR